jgi:hypothetical protein
MSLLCPNNHPNREGARFCQTCGMALRKAPSLPAERRVRLPRQTAGYGVGSAGALGISPVPPAPVHGVLPRSMSASRTSGGLATAIPLVMVISGGLAVVAGFFLPWLAFSLPAVSFLLGESKPVTISGYDLLMTGPGTYRTVPVVLIALIPAFGGVSLLLTGLWALPGVLWRRVSGLAIVLMGVGGIIALGVLLTGARSEPEQLLSELGLRGTISSFLSAALVRVEPGLGFAVNLVGFVLLVIGGVTDLVTKGRAPRTGV